MLGNSKVFGGGKVVGHGKPLSGNAALKDTFIKGDSEKARISGWLDRLGEFDLNLVYRPSTDQHIGIADGLSRMPTRMLTVSKDRLGERISMALQKVESRPVKVLEIEGTASRHQKYKESALYADVVDYLERVSLSLKGLSRNKRRQIVRKAKEYKLSSPNEVPSLRY